ncbi:MAG: ATP-binding cassette domain-containing protein [Acidovorax sp.]|nr:ATP-binding cassette domain-containing protein [Acidovorax sp.]
MPPHPDSFTPQGATAPTSVLQGATAPTSVLQGATAPTSVLQGAAAPAPALQGAAAPAPVLQASGVTAGYGGRTVLQHLDLQVQRAEIYALLGSNGAGKTSTLSLFLGFLAPSAGSVRVQGIDPVADPDGARRQLAYIPENVALYEHLSARENLSYLLDLAGQPEDAQAIDQALLAAGLAAEAHGRRVGGFSKGMRQKVAIALALARKVPALLLDEPTSGLDPQATAEFNRLLALLRAQGVAILMVTHDLLGAADVADRIGFIDAGRLVEEVAAGSIGGSNDDGRAGDRFDVRALHRRYAAQGAAA